MPERARLSLLHLWDSRNNRDAPWKRKRRRPVPLKSVAQAFPLQPHSSSPGGARRPQPRLITQLAPTGPPSSSKSALPLQETPQLATPAGTVWRTIRRAGACTTKNLPSAPHIGQPNPSSAAPRRPYRHLNMAAGARLSRRAGGTPSLWYSPRTFRRPTRRGAGACARRSEAEPRVRGERGWGRSPRLRIAGRGRPTRRAHSLGRRRSCRGWAGRGRAGGARR